MKKDKHITSSHNNANAVVSGSVIRGQFHFVRQGETIQCWMGEPNGHESEFVFEIHQSFAKDIIAGMVAVSQHCR